ncbi:hypothetical protein B0H13DRAFT_1925673 [Mycena leptocephala]|nr:hypothetical protein B0H13DRAFT_1925673 [Mycena leptocephala]
MSSLLDSDSLEARRHRARLAAQSKREEINVKACERMRRVRERVKQSPKAVQDHYLQKNHEYGATYREGHASSLRNRMKVRRLKQARRERLEGSTTAPAAEAIRE